MKYPNATRARALEMMEIDGVAKTSAQMGITKATLYKWRNARPCDGEKAAGAADAAAGARTLLAQSETDWADDKEKLLAENSQLRAENAKLRGALRALLS